MSFHWQNAFRTMAPASRRAARRMRGRRPAVLEALEERVLLASPTYYTVYDPSGNPADVESLPYAITQANSNANPAGSIIDFNPTVFSVPQTISLFTTLILTEVAGPEVIEGPTSAPLKISGGNSFQVCNVGVGTTASLTYLGIFNGDLATSGAGVFNGGTLSMTHCTVSGNTVTGGAGSGNYEGGGIYNTGSLTLAHCTISDNSVTGSIGIGTAGGGGIGGTGPLTATNCSITGNKVTGSVGGGDTGGGGLDCTGPLTATSCAITGNSVTGSILSGKTGGGGIDCTGPLTATSCSIEGNSVSGSHGDNYGGGIESTGTSNLTNCTISGNSVESAGDGGGVFNEGLSTLTGCTIAANSIDSGSGAGIANASTMTVVACAVFDNSANGLGLGGGISNRGTLAVADSAITGNAATLLAGGLVNFDGTTLISDSTVAADAAGYAGGMIVLAGSLTAVNDTIAENSSAESTYEMAVGEVYTVAGGITIAVGTATLDNTIVALNTAGNAPSDIAVDTGGQLSAASGNNLIGTGGSGGLANGVNGNQVGVANPGLAPLASNGGPTQTMALLPGSPAIDAGSNALAVDPVNNHALVDDQRESGFPRVFNGTVDIGAYELEADAAVSAVAVGWGTQTDALQTAADGVRLLPAGRKTDLPWLGIHELIVGFQEPVELTASDVTIQSVRGTKYEPVTVTGSGQTFTIAFARPVQKADRITITIAGSGFATFTRRIDVLPGDIGDFGVVKKADVKLMRATIKGAAGAPPAILGDIYGTGTVNGSDLKYVSHHLGTKLPGPKGPVKSVALARALVPDHDAAGHDHPSATVNRVPSDTGADVAPELSGTAHGTYHTIFNGTTYQFTGRGTISPMGKAELTGTLPSTFSESGGHWTISAGKKGKLLLVLLGRESDVEQPYQILGGTRTFAGDSGRGVAVLSILSSNRAGTGGRFALSFQGASTT